MTPRIVGIDARITPGAFGGVEQFTLGLINALTNDADSNQEYVCLVAAGSADWLAPHVGPMGRIVEHESVEPSSSRSWSGHARRYAARRLPAARQAWRAARQLAGRSASSDVPESDGLLEAAGAEVIHFPFQVGFTTSLPTIYQPWDLQHLHLPEFFSREARRHREVTYRTLCAQAAVVVVASEWTRDDLVTRYGLSPSKIRVIPVPPVTALYPRPSQEDLERTQSVLRLPRDFLFYPAQMWPHKNHARLLRAVAAASRSLGKPIPLVCSGTPNDGTARVVEEAKRLGLGEVLIVVGYVSQIEMQCLYASARAMVFPSLFEGWGMPILEAYAARLPVAASDATSLREAADGGALLFDPRDEASMSDAILRIWSDPALRDRLRAAGTEVVQRLTWSGAATAYRQVYDEARRTALG